MSTRVPWTRLWIRSPDSGSWFTMLVVSPSARHIERIDVDRRFYFADAEPFDRIEFALRVLRILAPPRMVVAVYQCRHDLRVEHGRDLARGPGATWGVLGVPPAASRQHIALAAAELTGQPQVPFLIDLLAGAVTEVG